MYRNRSYALCAAVLASMLSMEVLAWSQPSRPIPPVDPVGVNTGSKAPLASSFPGPLWQVVAPAGGTASATNGRLTLDVPGGRNHDALHGANEAVRVVQPIGNVDFDVAIKIDSPMTGTDNSTNQGLMVLIDDTNYITLALATNGSGVSLSAHSVKSGQPATLFEDHGVEDYQPPLHLRLTRTGTSYTAYYSVDGSAWVQCGSFSDARVPTLIGPFAGNYNATPSRAVPFTMAINWFNVL